MDDRARLFKYDTVREVYGDTTGEVSIHGVTCDRFSLNQLDIPPEMIISGPQYTFTSIDDKGFRTSKSLRAITIPDGAIIGEDAFSVCSARPNEIKILNEQTEK